MNKKRMFLCLLGACMMMAPLSAMAEAASRAELAAAPNDQVISGTVVDADGPMIGATVKVAGTNNATVTDLDGRFSLKCQPGDLLEVSYVGFSTKKVKAHQGMKIVMEEEKPFLAR